MNRRLAVALSRKDVRHTLLLASAGIAWGVGVAIFAMRAWGLALDDFFITFRYAENLATGNGFAFNPGEAVFGTTAPGFAALLALLRAVTGASVPGLGTLTTAFSLWLIALLVLDELAAAGRGVEGLTAGTLIALSPFVWPQHGSEIPLALLFLLLAARFVERAPVWAGLAAALATWCRPECLVGAALLAVWAIVRALRAGDDGRMPRRFVAALVALLAAATLFDLILLGSILPLTLAAKRAQSVWLPGVLVSGLGFWAHAFRAISELAFGPATAFVLALGIAGAPVLLWRGGPACRMLIAQAAVLAVAYPLLGVANYPWYAIPLVLALSAGAPAAAGELVRSLLRGPAPLQAEAAGARLARRAAAVTAASALLLPLAMVWPERVGHAYDSLAPNAHYDLYRRTGEWLRENTPPGATVAYVEVGTIGYFSARSVQDLLGLVTPRAIPFVPSGDMTGAFLTAPPDYFLFDRNLFGFLDPIRREPWFARAYRRAAHLDSTVGPFERIVVYARRPHGRIPPPREPLKHPVDRPANAPMSAPTDAPAHRHRRPPATPPDPSPEAPGDS